MKTTDPVPVASGRTDDAGGHELVRLQGILDLATDAVISVSERGIITVFNHGAERVFGYDQHEAIGMSLDLLIPRRFHTAHHAHMNEFAVSSRASRMMGDRKDVFGRRKDGSEFPAEASISRLDLPGETVFTVILRDVSERIHAQRMLEQNAEELRRSNAELEQFAYVASHDLQEPLRMVSSYCQLLEQRYAGKLDADADEFIGYAMDGAKRMQDLINDLLAYSRVGSKDIAAVPTHMAGAVRAARENLSTLIAETGATIVFDDLPVIKADPSQFATLFQNLIGNALKYRSADPPRVEIGAERTDDGWVFSVKDNGIGIEPTYFQRIFGLFQRLHPRAKYGGTGIGLAVCKRIIERHGGKIWVESQLGRGSTFHFMVPSND